MTTPKEIAGDKSASDATVNSANTGLLDELPWCSLTPIPEPKVSRTQLEELRKANASEAPLVQMLLKNFDLIDSNKDQSLTVAEIENFREPEPEQPWYIKLAKSAAKIFRTLTTQDQYVIHTGTFAAARGTFYLTPSKPMPCKSP